MGALSMHGLTRIPLPSRLLRPQDELHGPGDGVLSPSDAGNAVQDRQDGPREVREGASVLQADIAGKGLGVHGLWRGRGSGHDHGIARVLRPGEFLLSG